MRKEEETKVVEATLPAKEEVEGYAVCNTSAKKCLNDCIWPMPAHAFSYND